MAFAALQPAFVGADCLFFRALAAVESVELFVSPLGGVSFLKPLALRLCLRDFFALPLRRGLGGNFCARLAGICRPQRFAGAGLGELVKKTCHRPAHKPKIAQLQKGKL